MHNSQDSFNKPKIKISLFAFSTNLHSNKLLNTIKSLNKTQTCNEIIEIPNSKLHSIICSKHCVYIKTLELQCSNNTEHCDDDECMNFQSYIPNEVQQATKKFKNKVCYAYKLNKLRKKVFETFLTHEQVDISKSQILMYVRGATGSEKSQIRKAICEYFKKLNQQGKLKITAFTARLASLLIDGSPIHLLIGLLIDQNMDSKSIKNISSNWPNIGYLIFDEISMIGCTMLANMHLKLQKLKFEPQKPFGNLDIVFLGDLFNFHQLLTFLCMY